MRRIMLRGCNGRMGRCVSELCASRSDMVIAAGVDIDTTKRFNYPVYSNPIEYTGSADVAVDFSSPQQLDSLLDYCLRRKLPLVLATTGLSAGQIALIEKAAGEIPIFRSANMSLGISLLSELIARAAMVLGEDFNIEIVERHHNQKLDAPSGTAYMLLHSLEEALPYSPEPVFDRHSRSEKRPPHEIGMHAIRGGSIVGDHDVIFAGPGEYLTLSHSAVSREVFASGALRAAQFISSGLSPGMYDMKDILKV